MLFNFFNHSSKLVNYGSLRQGSNNVVTEPVTLNEAKSHLRIESSFTDDDTYINTLISVSRNICENYVGFLLAHNTKLYYYLDEFPVNEVIYMYGVSVIDSTSVSISYYDKDDAATTLSSDLYNIDSESIPTRIFLKENTSFPSTSNNIPSNIRVTFPAGPSTSLELPRSLYQAILLTIGHLYENRQNVVVGDGRPYEVPQTAEYLMNPFRVISI